MLDMEVNINPFLKDVVQDMKIKFETT